MFKFVTDGRTDGPSDGRTDAGGSLHRLTLFTHVSQKLEINPPTVFDILLAMLKHGHKYVIGRQVDNSLVLISSVMMR